MKLLILALLASQCFGAFSYRRSITVNTGQVSSGPHTNFPMPVVGTYSYLATVANGGKVQDAQGDDIGFYSNSDCSTGKLDWERVGYTATTGAVEFYVEVGSLDDGAVIYMCYGDATITTDQSNKTGVWDSNYKFVQHFGNGSLDLSDSTSNNLTMTNNGTTAGTGKLGNSAEFDGAADYYDVASTGYTTGALTITAWVKRQWSTTPNFYYPLFKVTGYGSTSGIATNLGSTTFQDWVAGDFILFGDGSNSGRNPRAIAAPGTLSDATWYHYGGVLGSGAAQLYVNGAARSMRVSGTASVPSVTNTARVGESSGTFADGPIDELRVSTSVRSAGWITTEYNSTNSPSSFYAIGSEVNLSGSVIRRRIIIQ